MRFDATISQSADAWAFRRVGQIGKDLAESGSNVTPAMKWRDLEESAYGHLSRPTGAMGSRQFDRAAVVVLIWRYPSFQPLQSWALIEASEPGSNIWTVRRVSWDRCRDYERAMNPIQQAAFMVTADPQPTMEVLDARVEEEFAERILSAVRGLSVPSILESRPCVVDGTRNGIETGEGQARIEWWCTGPTSWQELTRGVETIRRELDEAVANSAMA